MVTELMMQVRIQTEMVCLMQLIVKVQQALQAQQEQLVQQALQVLSLIHISEPTRPY